MIQPRNSRHGDQNRRGPVSSEEKSEKMLPLLQEANRSCNLRTSRVLTNVLLPLLH